MDPRRAMLRRITVSGYRSIRELTMDFGPLTVVTGGNGAGKTNLYRSLTLIHAAAQGTLAETVAAEGGMQSVLWAGSTGAAPASEIGLSADFGSLRYRLTLGLPGPNDPALALDPVVREETVAARVGERAPLMLQRKGASLTARQPDGRWRTYPNMLLMAETALARLRDPHQFPELDTLQRRFASWRFYHGFRTDRDSPLRKPQVAVCAPALDADGVQLAATLATALHLGGKGAAGERPEIERAIDAAFPGSTLDFVEAAGRYSVALKSPEIRRAFSAHELSDGNLRYLCLVAALCAYRRPPFLALNEPEASLHDELIEPLAELILRAARETQIVIVTHSLRLAELLGAHGAHHVALEKQGGATVAEQRREQAQAAE